jgi:probable H4MPT-linked C1 transfer pathway protein
LSAALNELIASAPPSASIAFTMTGELCDAFRNKAEGVRYIVAAVVEAAPSRTVRAYEVDGQLVPADAVIRSPQLAAASNWHALARFTGRVAAAGPALLIDIGSTTTDIISLVDGQPRPRGFNDTDRLLAGELVYSGVGRTPICAVTDRLPWREAEYPVAAELFATTADAYVVLGDLPEQPQCTSTADGRPLTREFCRERLARMICADTVTFSAQDAERAAAAVRHSQLARLSAATCQVVSNMGAAPATVVLSGDGEFLGKELVAELLQNAKTVSMARQVGAVASKCGPAHALAVLASEILG